MQNAGAEVHNMRELKISVGVQWWGAT